MTKPTLTGIFFFFIMNGIFAQKSIPAASEKLFKDVMKACNTRHVNWVIRAGKEVNEKESFLEFTDVETKAIQYIQLEKIKNADVQVLSFLILMQAIKFANADLKVMQEKIKFLNRIKSEQEKILALTKKTDLENSMTFAFFDSILYLSNRNARLAKGEIGDTVKFISSGNRKKVHRSMAGDLVLEVDSDLLTLSHAEELESHNLRGAEMGIEHMLSMLSYIQRGIDKSVDEITKSLK
jgi:hypothetical protein